MALAGLCSGAAAQQPASVKDEGWILSLRANVGLGPSWPGSDKLRFLAYPTASLRRAGTPNQFEAPDDGIGLSLLDNGVFRVGPVARFVGGRYASQDGRLIGSAQRVPVATGSTTIPGVTMCTTSSRSARIGFIR